MIKKFNDDKFYSKKAISKIFSKSNTHLITDSLNSYIHIDGLITAYVNHSDDVYKNEKHILKYYLEVDKNNNTPSSFTCEGEDNDNVKLINMSGFFHSYDYFIKWGKYGKDSPRTWCLCIEKTDCCNITSGSYRISAPLITPTNPIDLINSLSTNNLNEVFAKRKQLYLKNNHFIEHDNNINTRIIDKNIYLSLIYDSFYRTGEEDIIMYFYKESDIINKGLELGLEFNIEVENSNLSYKIQNINKAPISKYNSDENKLLDKTIENIKEKKLLKNKNEISINVIEYLNNKKQTPNIIFFKFSLIEYFKSNPDCKGVPSFNELVYFLFKNLDELSFLHDITTGEILLVEGNNLEIRLLKKTYNERLLKEFETLY